MAAQWLGDLASGAVSAFCGPARPHWGDQRVVGLGVSTTSAVASAGCSPLSSSLTPWASRSPRDGTLPVGRHAAVAPRGDHAPATVVTGPLPPVRGSGPPGSGVQRGCHASTGAARAAIQPEAAPTWCCHWLGVSGMGAFSTRPVAVTTPIRPSKRRGRQWPRSPRGRPAAVVPSLPRRTVLADIGRTIGRRPRSPSGN